MPCVPNGAVMPTEGTSMSEQTRDNHNVPIRYAGLQMCVPNDSFEPCTRSKAAVVKNTALQVLGRTSDDLLWIEHTPVSIQQPWQTRTLDTKWFELITIMK